MKTIFAFLTSVLVLTSAVQAGAAAPAFSDDQLRALHTQHVRIVRQASRACSANSHRGFMRSNHRNACVIGDVERQVRSLDDPDLLVFHQTLPPRRRFDAQRSMYDVRPFFN